MGDTTQLDFDVNIKVEEIDEDIQETITETSTDNVTNQQNKIDNQIINIDDSDEENVINENSNLDSKCNQEDSSNEVQASSSENDYEITLSSDSDYDKKFYMIYKKKLYTLTREKIQEGIEEQAKLVKSKSDLHLNKVIRPYHPEYNPHIRTVHENLLDNAIDLWKTWYENNPKIRNTPALYKCYICNKGWWRLDPFRQHIIIHKHPHFMITFESVGNESTIVASIGQPKKNKLVTVNSNCWKCNKSLKNNALTKVSAEKFTCDACQVELYTGDYIPRNERSNSIFCTICATYCSSEETLYRHMILYHTPNSDEPAVTNTRICNLCEEKFFVTTYHDCPKRSKFYKCHFCSNKYMTRKLVHFHMAMNKGFSTCPECSNKYKQCYLIEHLLNHAANYDMVQYCCKCKNNILYTSGALFNRHMISHGNASQRRRYRVQMLLPLKCVKGVIVDSVIPLDVSNKLLHKYVNDLRYMNYSVPEIIEIIKKQETMKPQENIEVSSGTVINQKENDITQDIPEKSIPNHSKDPEQSDVTKEIIEEPISDTIVDNDDDAIESDFESDNYAFQVQLDAEIERDLEIEKEISKVFKASNCYKKFLDKEANDPICDYDDEVCIVDKKDDVLVITDSDDDETSKLIIDSICEDVPNIDVKKEINRPDSDSDHSNDLVIDENVNSVSVKIEPCDDEKTNDSVLIQEPDMIDIKEEPLIDKNKDVCVSNVNICEVKKEKVDNEINASKKEENIRVLNYDLSEGEKLDFNDDIKFEYIKDEYDFKDIKCEIELNDWTIEKPSCSKKRKIEKNTDDTKYSCKYCEFKGYYKQFVYHIMNCQNVTCTYCTKTFADVNLYLLHLSEHKLKYLSCPQCFKNYNVSRYLRNHIVTHIFQLFLNESKYTEQNDLKQFKCHVCDNFVEIQEFFIHWESHLELNEINLDIMSDSEAELKSEMSPEMVEQALNILSDTRREVKHKVCFVCGKLFSRRIDSKRHLIEHLLHESKIDMASSGGFLPCPMCGQSIQEVPDWRQHMREHAHLKAYKCSLCPKMFCDSSNYSKHRKVHNQYNYICDLCGGKFCAKSSIIRHLATHEKRSPVPCPQCNKTFDSAHRLKRHIRIRHKRYQMACSVCKRRFDSCKQRWDHMWEKHKIRKFAADCPICKKQYRRFMDLKNHLRSEHGLHTVEKACNYTFKSISERHLQATEEIDIWAERVMKK